jgi:hypothetical protein
MTAKDAAPLDPSPPSATADQPPELTCHRGGCVCGRVRYAAHGAPERITICHCRWCQRRTGSAFGIEAVFRLDRVELPAHRIASYRHVSDESGRWLEQYFCPTCGANLGITLEAVPGIRTLAAGSFDDPGWLERIGCPVRHVYIRSARRWSELPKGIERYEAHFRP